MERVIDDSEEVGTAVMRRLSRCVVIDEEIRWIH